jgi:7-keto-8-aminopelargonate synthetase-like enzyme
MHREPDRVVRLQRNGKRFQNYAREHGLDTGTGAGLAVVPVIVGDSIATVMLGQALFQRGINVQPVLYPAVPVQSSRLRFFVTAMHTDEDIETAVNATVDEMRKLPERLRSLRLPG